MGKAKTVLIIDDERGYRDFYKYMLEPLGYEVFSANDGEQGLKMALEKRYDIILLDVHMPKMAGPDVLQKIKEKFPDQVVVIFSSSSDPSFSFEKKAKEMGAFDCLYKPVEVNDIIKVINKALKEDGNGKS